MSHINLLTGKFTDQKFTTTKLEFFSVFTKAQAFETVE